jgi:hypothetical protein
MVLLTSTTVLLSEKSGTRGWYGKF